MGAPLARTEARIVLNSVLDRYTGLRPGTRPSVRQSGSGTVLGFTELYLNLERV
jgi:cytochrome P450